MSASGSHIIVGLSGGVDSSVAALLLKQQSAHVEALFMKSWEEDDDDEYCASRQDLVDAAAVADVLGIEIDQVNFSVDYRERVFRHFLDEYRSGRTPNPDVLCNAEIKFKAFLDHALERGADKIATGHYARVQENDGRFQLLKGTDTGKDQSYFLCRLTQAQLSKSLFPVGHLNKTAVRLLALQHNLAVHDKKDSTGICFIGERPFREFLQRYLPAQRGLIKTESGKVIGEHAGAMFYTLGQREGLQIGGVKGAKEEPWFVAAKDTAANTLTVVQGHEHRLLMSRGLTAIDLSWTQTSPPASGSRLQAKTRYRQADQPCTILEISGNSCRVQFDSPQRAVTPGQTVAFYDGDECLGGGTISHTLAHTAP